MECGSRAASEGRLGGRQGRLLLAYLATRRAGTAARADVVSALWPSSPPGSVDATLNAIVSKLRAALRRIGLPSPYGVATELGSYVFAMPDAWVDVHAAQMALDEAEGAVRRGDLRAAWGPANVAAVIARQPFLADEDSAWVVHQRQALLRIMRRALVALSAVSTAHREFELGIQHAAEALAAEPFDETACQTLMRAHAAAGNRAEALRVYAQCREMFRDELGADPSTQTQQVFLSILRARY